MRDRFGHSPLTYGGSNPPGYITFTKLMIVTTVFDSPIVLHHCDELEMYSNAELQNSINHIFDLKEIRSNIDSSQQGRAYTTCHLWEQFPLPRIKGLENLSEWVAQQLLESAEVFGVPTAKRIGFGRTWVNIMFDQSEGLCHQHPLTLDGVAIFYANMPNGGGDLVFIKNGTEGSLIKDSNNEHCFYQTVNTGDLVIHKPNMPHAVSKSHNQEPRICFIYEFKYT